MIDGNTIIFSVVFICLAVAGIGISAFVLMKTGETKNPLLASLEEDKKALKKSGSSGDAMGFGSMLEKNNQLLSTWNTTEKAQNQLKMMQASGEAQE